MSEIRLTSPSRYYPETLGFSLDNSRGTRNGVVFHEILSTGTYCSTVGVRRVSVLVSPQLVRLEGLRPPCAETRKVNNLCLYS